jgi:hypothetical protein
MRELGNRTGGWLGCGPAFWIAAGRSPYALETVFGFFVRAVAEARFGVAWGRIQESYPQAVVLCSLCSYMFLCSQRQNGIFT